MVLIKEWTEDEDWIESRAPLTGNLQSESPRSQRIVDFVSFHEVRYYSLNAPPHHVGESLLMITDVGTSPRFPLHLRILRCIRNGLATKKFGGKSTFKWMHAVISYGSLVAIMLIVMGLMYYATTHTNITEYGKRGNRDN